MFTAFALSPASGGVTASQPEPASPQLTPPPPPPADRPPTPALREAQPDPERDAWAASIYQRFSSSALLSATLDIRLPTVPVILHPSAPRGGAPPPITARHLGFLRCDLSREGVGPGRFFPLFPEDAVEEVSGIDTGSLDRFGCGGHWASSGCIRLLAASSRDTYSSVDNSADGVDIDSAHGSIDSTNVCADGSSSSSDNDGTGSGGHEGRLALIPQDAFAALWVRLPGSGTRRDVECGSSELAVPPCSSEGGAGSNGSSSSSSSGGWHVPYAHLLPLQEAYGGLYRQLKAAGADLSHVHYMLRGWKTREGRPRMGSDGPRAPPAAATTAAGAGAGGRPRRGVVPAELASTRDLRAMVNWPGLLELLEEEGVQAVPTDGLRYWLARLGAGFQAQLAAAGVLCADSTVHHIIARSNRGVDHPLNYFVVDRGPNSAMGARVEGFRDANGVKLHMRDVVGERAFEVAHAACNLYHGVLYMGSRKGTPLPESLRELREGAFAQADEAIVARRVREARRVARSGGAAGGSVENAAGAGQADAARTAQQQQKQQQQQQQQQQQERAVLVCGGQARSAGVKRDRGGLSPQQDQQQRPQSAGCLEHAGCSNRVLSPSQQQVGRRRRLSSDMCPETELPAVAAAAAAGNEVGAAVAAAATEAAAEGEGEAEAEAGIAALSLCNSQEGVPLAGAEEAQQEQDAQQQQQQQRQQHRKPTADFNSLRARLRAALGVD